VAKFRGHRILECIFIVHLFSIQLEQNFSERGIAKHILICSQLFDLVLFVVSEVMSPYCFTVYTILIVFLCVKAATAFSTS